MSNPQSPDGDSPKGHFGPARTGRQVDLIKTRQVVPIQKKRAF